MSPDRIIVVDNDSRQITLLRQILTQSGYEMLVANTGEKAIQSVAEEQPDLVILEIFLPGSMDGFELARRVREFSGIPLIILSSRNQTEDMLRGFEAGADDYITKPFNTKILLARLSAVLKRCQGAVMPFTQVEIVCDHLKINLPRRQVTIDGEEIYLTETEYNLLLELARHCNQVLLHEYLLTTVWGAKFRSEVDYLRSYVHVLRRKLEGNSAHPRLIISKSGVGYMLVAGADALPAKNSGD
jgi:two-component system, OmpR family, KDP operon response regulator KdpE